MRQSGPVWTHSGAQNAEIHFFRQEMWLISIIVAFLPPELVHTFPLVLDANLIGLYKVSAFKRTFSDLHKVIRPISNAIFVTFKQFQKINFFGS